MNPMRLHGPKIQKDLFGLVLHSFFHGDKTLYSVVRDDGWVDYPNSPAEYFRVNNWYVKHAKGKVLDIGCGSGSYMLAFQKKGCVVYGVDIDANCVKTCKERGLKNVRQRNILKPGYFKRRRYDTIVLAGNNLGIAGNLKNLKKMLRYFHSITTKTGIVLGEGLNFATTENPLHKKYHALQKKKGRFPGIVTIRVDYKDMVGEWFDWMHTPLKELTAVAKETGWSVATTESKGDAHYRFILTKKS
jgi:cyclopropane fatty-acyl-phospholipid synthase-like methyltransferase